LPLSPSQTGSYLPHPHQSNRFQGHRIFGKVELYPRGLADEDVSGRALESIEDELNCGLAFANPSESGALEAIWECGNIAGEDDGEAEDDECCV